MPAQFSEIIVHITSSTEREFFMTGVLNGELLQGVGNYWIDELSKTVTATVVAVRMDNQALAELEHALALKLGLKKPVEFLISPFIEDDAQFFTLTALLNGHPCQRVFAYKMDKATDTVDLSCMQDIQWWLDDGLITDEDVTAMEIVLARKHRELHAGR